MNQSTYEVERNATGWQVRCKTCHYTQGGDTPQHTHCPFCHTEWKLGEPHPVEVNGRAAGDSGWR